MVPKSLAGRLLALSAITTLAALAFAAIGIGHVLERFVMRGLDQQLDTEVAMLVRAIGPDGMLDRARVVDLPAFGAKGWGWRIRGPAGEWTGGDAPPLRTEGGPPPPGPGPEGARPGDGLTGAGDRVHLRTLAVPVAGGVAIVTAAAPRRLVQAPLREAMVPLLGSLAILGIVLGIAAVVQLRLGLRPLRTLRTSVADVRAGRARHVPPDQPDELAPLAAELNALIDLNAVQLDHARRHVANLAHGLKTPLAALAVRLAEDGHDPQGTLGAMVADIDRRIRHHLGRARAATPGGRHVRTALAPAVADLVAVLRRVHAGRAIDCTMAIPAGLALAIDPQDLDELLGNLLDNAWRHARSAITIRAVATPPVVSVTIEDDGPGLSEAALAAALVPGGRLDERGDGHGFGLPIAQELAELNGGALALDRSPPGGLRVTVSLPGHRAPADRPPAGAA